MRPVRVEFAAFGSYPGEVSVDFAALAARGLFVVTGETGTGKSTIFDAMSYALFGVMPLKPGHDIRSHHAADDRPTYARFAFAIDGSTYVAERHPEQERAAKRGGGMVRDAAKVNFTRVDPDGSTTVLATKVREMEAAVAEVVGLDAAQFQRVMLLPQGEVAKFLLDDSTDREKLLSALFGGGVYERIGLVLQNEANELQRQVGAADEALRHHLANAQARMADLRGYVGVDAPGDDDTADDTADDTGEDTAEDAVADRAALGEFSAAVTAPLQQLRAQATAAQEKAAKDAEVLTEARAAATRRENALTIRAVLADLEQRRPALEATATSAEASRRARAVVDAADADNVAQDALGKACRRRDQARTALVAQVTASGLDVRTEPAAALTDDLEALAERIRIQGQLLADRSSATDALAARQADLTDLQAAHTSATEALASADAELEQLAVRLSELADAQSQMDQLTLEGEKLRDALRAVTEREAARSAVHACADELATAQEVAEEVLRRFIETTAPRLAAQLMAGEACPVCGSQEHPHPAVAEDGDPVDFEALSVAQSEVDSARARRADAEAHLATVLSGLGEWADSSQEDLSARVDTNAEAQRVAQERCDAAATLEAARDRIDAERTALRGEVDRRDGQIIAARTAVADAEEKFRLATEAAADIDPERREAERIAVAEVRRLGAELVDAEREVGTAEARAETTASTVAHAVNTSGFDSVETARAALMPEAAEREAIDAHAQLIGDLARETGKLQALEAQGIPEEQPDMDGLEAAAALSAAQATEMVERRTLADGAMEQLLAELDAHDEVGAGSEALRRRAALTERAQRVCRGQGAIRVSLQRWVLGRELDRVVAAASVHLAQMTAGRYTLQRAREVTGGRAAKGLDLEVLDAHTGRPRSPRSLSGGEQFQASLALALGLADVVSQGGAGSGRRIEALFIDEGFGSLDPLALDDAIETLHHLHASGRMVGAITHVEAMKERLHPGIVVSRLPDGKGSTLRVNP